MDYHLLLSEIRVKISKLYPTLGINKKREIERLIFEIAKIKNSPELSFLDEKYKSYENLKRKLLKLRFPVLYNKVPLDKFYLPKLDLSKEYELKKEKLDINPEYIYYEKETEGLEILNNLKEKFPKAQFIKIDRLKEIKEKLSHYNYNERTKNIIVVKEKFDFLKNCPCTKNCVSCHYFIINLGFGCPFECTYCYLQGYQNINAIILPANMDDFFKEFKEKFSNLKRKIRIGSGEFTDSLAFDHITDFSSKIVSFFKNIENVYFELKTKSPDISNLIKIDPSKNIVISYSLNPQNISNTEELFTAKISDRIKNLKILYDYGYSVAFHLDPIIAFEKWEAMYMDLINEINKNCTEVEFKWISLGSFRFNPEIKKTIEQRFPHSKIMDSEMALDFDKKLRYHFDKRYEIYSKILGYLTKYKIKASNIYLCMESKEMWDKLKLKTDFNWR